MPLARRLFLPSGEISRLRFLSYGILLVALKLALDWFITTIVFHQTWNPREYIWSKSPAIRLTRTTGRDFDIYLALLGVAAPFAWIGVCLCLQRLRTAGQPLWLAAFFFVPIAKWILFCVLALSPPDEKSAVPPEKNLPNEWWWPFHSAFGSAFASVILSTLLTVPLSLLSIYGLKRYGSTLFLGMPFYMGFLATFLHNLRQPRSFAASLTTTLLSVMLAGMIFVALAYEGLICLLMAAPIILVEAFCGCLLAHFLRRQHWRNRGPSSAAAFIVLPLLFAADANPIAPSPRALATEIRVAAPPAVVWAHVIAFSEIPPPGELLFRAGIAFPIRATIEGQGVGAVRHCNFSTGSFVEPITVWQEPRQLSFNVSQQPDPLTELSPYGHIDTPHLHGMFQSYRGEFLLIAQNDGSTLLRGTTWYTNQLEPAAYWNLWSDYVIHQIHLRVLRHIRRESERL